MTNPKATHSAVVPKVIGSDFELGNLILGREDERGTGAAASRALLKQIDGYPRGEQTDTAPEETRSGGWYSANSSYGGWGQSPTTSPGGTGAQWQSSYDPQDWGRKHLSSNGGCCYIDLDHLEICTPEVRTARDFVAASRAMLLIARDAMHAANAELPPGEHLVVLANNSDGKGNSYGTHLSFLVSRRAWRRLFDRIDLFILASYQASSLVVTGQGKVGAENARPHVPYQISQRADFIDTLLGVQTTWKRPLVNARDESLCGNEPYNVGGPLARLHCIFYDHTLCPVSTYLKVGVMQLVLAMLEAGWSPAELMLADPVQAVYLWSHDPDLNTCARMANRKAVTAVELQRMFFKHVAAFAATDECAGAVPDAAGILTLWDDTLTHLEKKNFSELARRLDWVLKRSLLEGVLESRPALDWSSPEIKHLDLLYAGLDHNEGLFWACERNRLVTPVVTEGEIERFIHQPPEDTRAWTRAMLLRVGGERATAVDWHKATFDCGTGRWPMLKTAELSNPLSHTRADWERHFEEDRSLTDMLAGMV